ncbi:MAG TPA: cysteine-rich CWC family protein [Verrucomicrobiae bacterium]|nr:cysteine-rich CWC family protein [Verrucomicrobiae bacterium]
MIPSPEKCPLCGRPNDCQLCTNAAYKGPCWCAQMEIPDALLARVPREFQNRNCLCRGCVVEFQRAKNSGSSSAAHPEILSA